MTLFLYTLYLKYVEGEALGKGRLMQLAKEAALWGSNGGEDGSSGDYEHQVLIRASFNS